MITRFWLDSSPSTNDGCGVSVQDATGGFHRRSSCPAEDQVAALDGVFASEAIQYGLSVGSEIVLFIGCTSWRLPDRGVVRVRFERVP